MFEVAVAPEFERWFDALDSGDAELVATAMDVLEREGPELDGVRASRALLWYDGLAPPLVPLGSSARGGQAYWGADFLQSFQDFVFWHAEAVRCLESAAVQERLLELDASAAEVAFAAIEKLRAKLSATRVHATYETWRSRMVRSAPFQPRTVAESLRRALIDVLEAVGLQRYDMLASLSGLRELTLTGREPRLRVLYGIDVVRRRILLILGESLDRSYYGDAVRLAERRFSEFMTAMPPRALTRLSAARNR